MDAEKIRTAGAILPAGLSTLEAHRSFATWLLVILFLTIIVKWIAASKESRSRGKLALGMILITNDATLYQGNKGRELVYRYSAGIDGKIIDKRLETPRPNPTQPKE